MKAYFKQLGQKITFIPVTIVDIINGVLNGIKTQCSNAKGAIIFFTLLALVVEMFTEGAVGVVKFLLEQLNEIMKSIALVSQGNGFSVVILVVVIIILFKKNP